MNFRILLIGLIAGSLCTACSSKKGGVAGGGQRDTLAGAADTTKKAAARQGKLEVRLPQAPLERPDPDAELGAIGGVSGTAGGGGGAAADTSDIPLAPSDAQWTLFCASVGSADHVALSKQLKTELLERTGMREWYILHESDRSLLYYAYYRSTNDPADAAETKRAQADRKKISEFLDDGGERPFRAAHFVPLNAPDPDAPPQWNLANTPEDKVWTLMIGAYKDTPDRKRLAVEAVREAREKFGVEAYYHHGDTVSNVFVGTWPEAAVVEERVDAAGGANMFRDEIMVLPPGWKDPGGARNKQGKAVRVVGQQLVPVDEDLLAKIGQYPEMGVNGDQLIYKDPKTGRQSVQGSQVVAIPRSSKTLFRENAEAWRDAQAAGRAGVGGRANGIGLRPGMDLGGDGGAANDPFRQAPLNEDDGTGWHGPDGFSQQQQQQPTNTTRRPSGRSAGGLRSIEDE